MRDFHLINSRKNEQPDQAGRALFFGDKRVPNFCSILNDLRNIGIFSLAIKSFKRV